MANEQPGEDVPPEQEEKQVRTVDLPGEEGNEVVVQQNVGPDAEWGQGEWPSPTTEPTGPATGTTPEGAQAASRREQAAPQPPAAGSATQPDLQQDGTTGGDRGPARSSDVGIGPAGEVDPPASLRDALDADPQAGGSQATPHEDDEVDPHPG